MQLEAAILWCPVLHLVARHASEKGTPLKQPAMNPSQHYALPAYDGTGGTARAPQKTGGTPTSSYP